MRKIFKTQESSLEDFFNNLPVEDKVIHSQNQDVFKTLTGALGMQDYFSVSEDRGYTNINRYLYDEDFKKSVADSDLEYYALASIKGFHEMPDYSTEYIQEHYSKIGVCYDGETLYRGMWFADPDTIYDFVTSHVEGEVITYPSFTSATVVSPKDPCRHKLSGNWGSMPLQITIKQKEKTSGKWVDKRKLKNDEGEILFPPEQDFLTTRVDTILSERLPDRFRNPLLKIFTRTKDGGGYLHMTLGDICGDLEPSEVFDNPNFAWFNTNLKKRGLMPRERWSRDTYLHKLASKSKFKGGKLAIFSQASDSLSNYVRLQEKTGKFDIVNAKIFLKEV